jgi:hypothetical protein
MTKFIAIFVMKLVTSKAAAKHELFSPNWPKASLMEVELKQHSKV